MKNKEAWEKLLDVLSRQRAEYGQFVDLLKKKEQLIIDGKAKELEKLVKEENKKVDGIEKLEEERLSVANEFAGEDGKTPSLMELLERAPKEMREPIEKEAMSLMETLNQIAALNRSNAELIQTSMEYIKYNINLLATSGAKEGIYEIDGKMRSAEKKLSGFLNRQV
ncbi:MAG: flagellar protein FlgN [bacterium]